MRPRWWWLAGLALSAHVALLLWGILLHYPNVDEVAHLPSGVAHWKYQRFDMYRVNPPLVRMVAAFPAWLSGIEYDWSKYSDAVGQRPEFRIGRARQRKRQIELHEDFIAPRIACISFSVLGCLLLTAWIYSVVGPFGANLACIFWCFSPNLLAHAQTIVPDVGMVAMGLLASFGFWRYLNGPTTARAVLAGICLGAALLTKLTWLTSVITLPAATAMCLLLYPEGFPKCRVLKRIADLSVIWLSALLVLNAGYLFEGTGTTLGEYQFCSEALGGEGCDTNQLGNRFANSQLAMLPLPIPKNYLLGIDFLRHEVESKRWSFLLGEHRFGSWPHYYLMTTLFKTPEPTLLATLVGLILCIWHFTPTRIDARLMATILVLGVPAMTAFASVSLQGGFNHHHRYVLQIYPVFFLFIAGLGCCSRHSFGPKPSVAKLSSETGNDRLHGLGPNANLTMARQPAAESQKTHGICQTDRLSTTCRVLAVSSTVAMLISSMNVAPHFLSYFNVIAGGPTEGWRVLGFSNVDWGQDLLFVKNWIDDHQDCRPLKIDARSGAEPEWFLPGATRPPARVEPIRDPQLQHQSSEWWIINVRSLRASPNRTGHEYLQQLMPVEHIGYTHRVYRIDAKARKTVAKSAKSAER